MMMLPAKHVIKVGVVLASLILLCIAVLVIRFVVGESGGLSLDSLTVLILSLLLAWAVSSVLHDRPVIFAVLLAAASFLLCLALALWADAWPSSDFEVMYSLALRLKSGGVEAVRDSEYLFRWPYQSLFVIYQALAVSPVLGDFTTLLIGNAVWMAGTAALIYGIARQAYSSRTAAFLAVLYALYPAPYFLAPVLTNQHISLCFILLGVWLFLQKPSLRYGVVAGVPLALGNAFRPDGILVFAALLLLALTVWFLYEKRPLWSSVHRVLPLLAANGSGLLVSVLLSALVVFSGVSPDGLKNPDPLWKLVVGLNDATDGQFSAPLGEEVFAVEDVRTRHDLEKDVISRHLSAGPGEIVDFLFRKALRFWGSYDYTGWAFTEEDERTVPLYGRPIQEVLETLRQTERLEFLLVVLLAFVSACLLLPRGRRTGLLPVLCGLVVVLFFGVYLVAEVQTRYRYFIIPFLFMLAGPGLDRIFSPHVRSVSIPLPA